ncbi:hypothetical protein [Streptomyces sp. NPDC020607]|uniref:hypothetical protein n=1 Tax=Streptomyces sp. NPDC020607 TaxID=3365082 RepID=UPI00379A437F
METSGPTLRSRPRNGHRAAAPPGAAAWPMRVARSSRAVRQGPPARPGPPTCQGAPARPASRTVVSSLAGTLFTVAAYHLVFGSMLGPVPAWDARTVAAAVLFHTALSLRLALPRDEARRTRWATLRSRWSSGTRAPAPATLTSRPLGAGSLARSLRLLWAFLARLLRPFRAPLSLAPPPPAATHAPARPTRALPLPLLLADALVRRGPPARPPLTV